jgi:hypothetical protein
VYTKNENKKGSKMLIAKVIRKDICGERVESDFPWEKIGKKGKNLLKEAQEWIKKNFKKDPDRSEKENKEGFYSRMISPFVENKYIKESTNKGFPNHIFYNGYTTVFDSFGKVLYILTIDIHQIEEVK